MSSLAATQADGYYIPPSYLESGAYKKKSLNRYNNSRGHNQYLTNSICRFELPFDGFCTGCDGIVGKGTRFNAHKSHVDDYFTTRIYEFTATCRACGACEFKIRTNPRDRTFDYVSGIRRKVEEFDTADAGTHGVIDTEYGNGILKYENGRGLISGGGEVDGPTTTTTTTVMTSMLRNLERDVVGHRRAQTEHERMSSLLDINSRMIDDGAVNASIRKGFRSDRKAKRRRLERASDMGLGRGIELLDDDYDDDGDEGMRLGSVRREETMKAGAAEKERFGNLRAGSIFGSMMRTVGGSAAAPAAVITGGPPPASNDEKKPRRETRHGARIVVGRMRRSTTPRHDDVGNDGRNSRSYSSRGGPGDDDGGKSSHLDEDGGALAALSSCYASDSD